MLVRIFFPCFSILACLSAISYSQSTGQTQMSAVASSQGITVLDGIRPVLTFQQAAQSKDGKWPRANYVHPLYDLDGEMITEDFPSDHGHHRGVFWAWHQVLVGDKALGDAWACENFQWDVQQANVVTGQKQATISATTLWKSPDLVSNDGQLIPCVREHATIVVHAAEANVRSIDFNLEFLALVDDVRIGGSDDDKGYGGFSPRIKLTDDVHFIGNGGPVEPQVTAVQAGPWIDVGNKQGGVVILAHSSNPGHPQPWILRGSRSMQNVAYPGRHPVPLSKTEPLRLRYRLGIHRGELTADQIDELWHEYAK